MIKLVFCLRRLPTLSVSEFQRYWFENHAELVRQHAPALRIRRYTQSHTFSDVRLSPAIEFRGGRDRSVSTVWPNCGGTAPTTWSRRSSTTEGLDAGRALLEDERTFIDLPNSPLFFTNEHVIIAN